MKKKIAVYTSTRADFGLLKPLISKLIRNPSLELRLFVTGTHLDPDFGSTVSEIEKEFSDQIYYRVVESMKEDPILKNLKTMGALVQKYAAALAADPVDFTLVLGDRYEALCFGLVSVSLSIPLIHLHGGELTLGAIDDRFRHSLTKFANWHFVACETYRQRVIQMGEQPETVFNVGALGVDNALNGKRLTREELSRDLSQSFEKFEEIYLFTFHPETNSEDYGIALLEAFLKNLGDRITKHKGLVIMTGVNSDTGADAVRKSLQRFQESYPERTLFRESLGMVRYLSVMEIATAVLGNSSSGILEAFSMKTGTVNIGSRQKGRERESSVLDLKTVLQCAHFDFESVVRIKRKLLQSSPGKSLFGNGNTSDLIARQIAEIGQGKVPQMSKEFFDLGKQQ